MFLIGSPFYIFLPAKNRLHDHYKLSCLHCSEQENYNEDTPQRSEKAFSKLQCLLNISDVYDYKYYINCLFGKEVLPNCFHWSRHGYAVYTNSPSNYPQKWKSEKNPAISLQAAKWHQSASVQYLMLQILLEKGHSLTGPIAFCRCLRKLLWDGDFGHLICNHLCYL